MRLVAAALGRAAQAGLDVVEPPGLGLGVEQEALQDEQPRGVGVLVDLADLSAKELAAVRRRAAGYVFQDLNLIPTLTALENVSLPLELDGRRRTRSIAQSALDDVGVGELGARYPDELSGGQQQRVAIARALVGDRRLVLADEPTGALDSETGEAVLGLLRRRVDAGAAGVLVTHEQRHAAWADRVVFLRDGTIVDSTSYDVSVDAASALR